MPAHPAGPTVPRSAIFQRAADGRPREASGAQQDASEVLRQRRLTGRGVGFSGPVGHMGARKATFLDANTRRAGKRPEDEIRRQVLVQAWSLTRPLSPPPHLALASSRRVSSLCMDPTCNSCPTRRPVPQHAHAVEHSEEAAEQNEGAEGESTWKSRSWRCRMSLTSLTTSWRATMATSRGQSALAIAVRRHFPIVACRGPRAEQGVSAFSSSAPLSAMGLPLQRTACNER